MAKVSVIIVREGKNCTSNKNELMYNSKMCQDNILAICLLSDGFHLTCLCARYYTDSSRFNTTKFSEKCATYVRKHSTISNSMKNDTRGFIRYLKCFNTPSYLCKEINFRDCRYMTTTMYQRSIFYAMYIVFNNPSLTGL